MMPIVLPVTHRSLAHWRDTVRETRADIFLTFLSEDIPNAASGFRLIFSAQAFPGFQKRVTKVEGEMGGSGINRTIRR